VIAVRRAVPADAPALVRLQLRLDEQSPFMLLEPGERSTSPQPVAERLRAQSTVGGFDLVAVDDSQPADQQLVGWLECSVPPFRRAAHVGYVVLGVDAGWSGRGLGRRLLGAADDEAEARDLSRLELTVMVDNVRAVGLYLRAGYQLEGVRRGAVQRDGVLVDEYCMARSSRVARAY
jgi:ribosomal protein S18 acetylase RimI-like enzyme